MQNELVFAFEPTNMTDFATGGNMTDFTNFSRTDKEQIPSSGIAAPRDFSNFSHIENEQRPPAPPIAQPPDFSINTCTSDYLSTSCKVLKELMGLKPEEVKDYGLVGYQYFVIKNVLGNLDPGNLTKVLRNLPTDELIQIKQLLSPGEFNKTMSIIPESVRTEILNRTAVK